MIYFFLLYGEWYLGDIGYKKSTRPHKSFSLSYLYYMLKDILRDIGKKIFIYFKKSW